MAMMLTLITTSHLFAQQAAPKADATLKVDIPASAYKMDFVLVPGDESKHIKPFYMGTTEVTWEPFDAYVYRLDDPNAPPPGKGPDAVTHPSKSYLPPDRGFGHEGFAAITLSHKNARTFCEWLSKISGKKVRLATADEWQHACELGDKGDGQFTEATAKDFAWFAANADEKTHMVATRKPNALGIYDMHGNVAEWVNGPDGAALTKGGSYQDDLDKIKNPADSVAGDPAWNGSDPQIPKSKWWLSDGPMIGFRVVIEPDDSKSPNAPAPAAAPPAEKPVKN